MTKKYGIVSWMYHGEMRDNLLFGGVTFDTFEEAWDFIYENDPNENDDEHYYDDYYVEEVK